MIKLHEVAKVNSKQIDKNFTYKDIRYIDIASVTKGNIDNIQNLKTTDAPSRAKRLVKKNDILYSTVRPNLEHYVFIKDEVSPNTVASTGFAVITPDEKIIDPYYLYCLLTQPRYTQFLSQVAEQAVSTYPTVSPNTIEDLEFNLPPLPEQKRISSILSSFDNKIEQLKKENNILEDIAQNIFKEWFVKYNFPNKDGKPYKDNNGKMIDSELGLIPEGWRVEKVGDVIKTVLGGTPDTTKAEYWSNGTIPWINSGKVNDFRIYEPTTYITQKALNESATKLMPTGTVVIAITGATLGQVSKLEIDAAGNQSVIGIQPNRYFSSSYLYYWMLENIQILIDHATGGAQQHINKNDVDNSLFLTPKENILKDNTDVLSRLSDKISNNCFQINNLSSARESLLSKLIRIISL